MTPGVLKNWLRSSVRVLKVQAYRAGQVANQVQVWGRGGVRQTQFHHGDFDVAQFVDDDVRSVNFVGAGFGGAVIAAGLACVGSQGNDIVGGGVCVAHEVGSFSKPPHSACWGGFGPLQSNDQFVSGLNGRAGGGDA